MPIIFSILITLAWLSPAIAGTIFFDFELRGDQCVVVNRGDSSAYYPLFFQLGRDGKWMELKSDRQPAELLPGGTLAASLIDTSAPAPPPLTDPLGPKGGGRGVGENALMVRSANFPPALTLPRKGGADFPDIEYLLPVLIRFFDRAGVSFGQVSVLRTPPETGYKISAGYV
jgi:hypothetical protein